MLASLARYRARRIGAFPFAYRGLKIITPLSLRFPDFQRTPRMLLLPDAVAQPFDAFLDHQALSSQNKAICLKWLRFYWDFCIKYQHDPYLTKNISLFLDKLRAKQQSDLQLRQARQTVIWFYRLQSRKKKAEYAEACLETSATSQQPEICAVIPPLCKVKTAEAAPIAPQDSLSIHEATAPQGFSWVSVFDGLNTAIKLRHYSPKTLKSYRSWTRHLQTFTQSKDQQTLTQQDVVAFLSHLAVTKQVSASTQNQAFNALLFLYQHVLKREFGDIKGVARAKRRPYIPVVLSRAEVDLIFDHLDAPVSLIAQLLYGCGLRLFECLTLRVGCLNFDAGVLTVHDGKGQKDRSVPLPQTLIASLNKQLEKVFQQHNADLKARYAGVFLPDQLSRKYPRAAQEISWQWLFPAQSLTLIPENGEFRRYHIHESVVQKAIKQAVRDAKIIKRASAHTFRHSFAGG